MVVSDPGPAARIRQVTGASVDSSPPVLLRPGLRRRDAPAGLRLASHRRAADLRRGAGRAARSCRLTDRHDLAEWSISPRTTDASVYFVAGTGAWRVDLETLARSSVSPTSAAPKCARGAWSAPRWAPPRCRRAIAGGRCRSRSGPGDALRADRHRAKTALGVSRARHHRPSAVLSRRRGPDPLCRPADRPRLGHRPRAAAATAACTRARTACSGSPTRSGFRARASVAFVDWPRGMRVIDVDTGAVRWITRFPAWHAAPDDARTAHSSATPTFPDRGLHLLSTSTAEDDRRPSSCAAQRGEQRGHPLGRAVPLQRRPGRGARRAQHTHPHPRFSPDGNSRVLSPPTAAGTRSSTKPCWRTEHDARAPCWRANGCARRSAPAASPARAAGSRTASCSAISRSCPRNTPSTSCSIASATSAPARCWKSPIPASPVPKKLAPGADLRTDCARYAIYRDGVRAEDRTDVVDLWRDDLVSFLIGSGITIDGALEAAGVPTHKDRWVLRTDAADRARRSVPRRSHRDHALAVAPRRRSPRRR